MTIKQLLTFLGVVGPIVAAIAPWVGPFFDFKLISDYFQPALNSVASISGAIAVLTTLAFTHKTGAEKKKRVAAACLVGAVLSFILCLVLKNTVGTVWAPGMVLTLVVRVVWILVYLLFYVLLFVALCEVALLIPAKEPKSTKPAPSKKKSKPVRTKQP